MPRIILALASALLLAGASSPADACHHDEASTHAEAASSCEHGKQACSHASDETCPHHADKSVEEGATCPHHAAGDACHCDHHGAKPAEAAAPARVES